MRACTRASLSLWAEWEEDSGTGIVVVVVGDAPKRIPGRELGNYIIGDDRRRDLD